MNKKEYATKHRKDNDFDINRLKKMIERLSRRNPNSQLAAEKKAELEERKKIVDIEDSGEFLTAYNIVLNNIDKKRRDRK